eukprot:3024572-Amphidinium_carterae.2
MKRSSSGRPPLPWETGLLRQVRTGVVQLSAEDALPDARLSHEKFWEGQLPFGGARERAFAFAAAAAPSGPTSQPEPDHRQTLLSVWLQTTQASPGIVAFKQVHSAHNEQTPFIATFFVPVDNTTSWNICWALFLSPLQKPTR